MTLRRRLVLGILALLAAVIVVIGVLSVVALRGMLVDRLDQQLAAATNRSQVGFDGGGLGPDIPPVQAVLALPGQPAGTLGALIRGDLISAAILTNDGLPRILSADDAALLLAVPTDGEPRTITLSSLGSFRIVAVPQPDEATLLVGLPLTDVDATTLQLSLLIGGIGLAGLLAAALAGAFVVRLALRPLDRVAATATRVAELPLDRGEVALAERVPASDADPGTEVGRVGAALNVMLEHVASALEARQASERRVRTFVADASHELRTPLASIRGYSELTRRSGHDLPEDVVHAIGRVESESVRMTALVEDLLLLARLDDAPALAGDEVDLSRLLVDAVSDARAAGPDHQWRIDLPEEPVLTHGDGSRLTQVIANLLANARVHTPAGTTVTASVRRDHADGEPVVVLEVRDDGPGIDPELVPTVFERFVRGDGSRTRATGGTGLGLAIVSAVVEAHGGRAEVESVPGETVFRVILPDSA
jgi:two-component system, OmpR family, sensor kinase